MHNLIAKIDDLLIPNSEKKQQIDQAVHVLQTTFKDRSDKVVEAILKDQGVFIEALMVLEAADKIDYHTVNLTSLRVRAFDVLVGIIRDFEKTELIKSQLQRDFSAGITLNKADDILYHTNLFLYGLIYCPDFDKAILFGKKTLELIMVETGMFEEKLRLFSNLIQYYSLIGQFDTAKKFVTEGQKYVSLSTFDAYNALYVLAVSTYYNEQGDFENVVKLIQSNQLLLEKQQAYPSLYFFILNQLSHALIKQGDIDAGRKILDQAETAARKFYITDENSFFARWYAIKALSQFSQPELFLASKQLLEKSLRIYQQLYCGDDKHKNQASIHLLLGELYFLNQQNGPAKKHFLQSESIFKKILNGNKNHETAELEKFLAAL